MARDHARFQTAIWDDGDWLALHFHSQWLYEALASSKQLSYCGVVPYIPKRLTRLGRGLTGPIVKAAVSELAQRRFVLVDNDTDELLVRSYVRHDGVMNRSNMGKAVAKALDIVLSDALRDAVVAELGRLFREQPDLSGWTGFAEIRPDLHERVREAAMQSPMQSAMQSPMQSAMQSAMQSPMDDPMPSPDAWAM